jgi:hypothetical protein
MDHKELQGTADPMRSSGANFDPSVHALFIEKNQYMLLNCDCFGAPGFAGGDQASPHGPGR